MTSVKTRTAVYSVRSRAETLQDQTVALPVGFEMKTTMRAASSHGAHGTPENVVFIFIIYLLFFTHFLQQNNELIR